MTVTEVIALSQSLSIARFVNVVKLYLAFLLSRILRRSVNWGQPFALSLEPTTVCNLKCPECPTGLGILKRSSGTMSDRTFEQIIEHLPRNTFFINLYLQGEPFIHPKLLAWIKVIHSKKRFTVVSTNAQLITEKVATEIVHSGLSKLIIGLDGLTQESYEQYRKGGSVDKVYHAIRAIHNAKRTFGTRFPILVVQFIAFNHNEKEIESLNTIKKLGVDEVVIKTAQLISTQAHSERIPTKKKLTRYIPKSGKLILRRKSYNHCWRIFSSMVITWNGVVHPCCFDKDGLYPLGDIGETQLSEVWKSDQLADIRKTVLRKRADILMCQNCTEGQKWWL